MSSVTLALRLLSRPTARILRQPWGQALAKNLPAAIMVLLLLYSLKSGQLSAQGELFEGLAMALVAVCHATWNRGLLSLSVGTGFLMILHWFFCT